jgi:serine/threonine protein kinase
VSTERTSGVLIGQTLGKRYQLRRLIGSGGMGAVYEAEHLVTKRIGALKLLHPRYATVPEVVARFVMEASAAGRIDNAHVVQTFDAGELESGEPYMFMELLAGEPISSVIQRRRRLRFDEARELVLQAASGLAAAHAAGVVHRDVKPENLFLCRGERPFVKVLDFGISKFARPEGDPRLTSEGSPLGTPYYMSPEQVMGQRDLDQRTDVYSLGVVLYECVTGEVPFKAETLPALGIRISQGHFVAATELAPELPPGLDEIIDRAMSLDANDRFPDMAAFAAALRAFFSAPAVSFAPTLVADSTPPSETAGSPPTLPAARASDNSLRAPAASPPRSARAGRRWTVSLVLVGAGVLLSLALFKAGRAGAPPAPAVADVPSVGPGGPLASRESAAPAPSPGTLAAAVAASAAASSAVVSAETDAGAATPIVSARARRAVERPPVSASRAEKDGLGVENPF